MAMEQNNTYRIKEAICIDDIDVNLGKYAIVSNEGSAYQSFVKDDEIFVTTMHNFSCYEDNRFLHFLAKKFR